MRLLETSTLQFEEFLSSKRPPYAILSHTWNEAEVTFDEWLSSHQEVKRKSGYQKIVDFVESPKNMGSLMYGWIHAASTNEAVLSSLNQ
jgi:hypothetical protein